MNPRASSGALRRGVARASLWVASTLGVSPLLAQEPGDSAWLRVTRGPGSESCPDAEQLGEAVAALLGRPLDALPAPLLVDFSFEGGHFVARLRPEPDARPRELSARHADCAPLELAVVTALALYLDATRPDPSPEPPPGLAGERTTSASSELSAAAPSASSPRNPAPYRRLSLDVGGGVLVGVGVPAAPAFAADVGYRLGRARALVAGTWLPTAGREAPPGHVELELWALSAEFCVEVGRWGALGLEPCVGFAGGEQSARARGFDVDGANGQPWFAVPLGVVFELGRDAGSSSEHLRLGLGGFLPTDRRTFSVEGLGPVIVPEAVVGWFWLRGGLSFGL